MGFPVDWIPAAPRAIAGALACLVMGCTGAPDGTTVEAPTYVVEIHTELNVAVQARVMRALRQARHSAGSVVVFSLDTPGGEVTTMEEIGDAIRKASTAEPPVTTVGFVGGGPHGGAFSAGSFIALACTQLYMAKFTSM